MLRWWKQNFVSAEGALFAARCHTHTHACTQKGINKNTCAIERVCIEGNLYDTYTCTQVSQLKICNECLVNLTVLLMIYMLIRGHKSRFTSSIKLNANSHKHTLTRMHRLTDGRRNTEKQFRPKVYYYIYIYRFMRSICTKKKKKRMHTKQRMKVLSFLLTLFFIRCVRFSHSKRHANATIFSFFYVIFIQCSSIRMKMCLLYELEQDIRSHSQSHSISSMKQSRTELQRRISNRISNSDSTLLWFYQRKLFNPP